MINDKCKMINERQSKLVKASQTKMVGLTQWRRFLPRMARMARMGIMQNAECRMQNEEFLSVKSVKSVVQFLSSMKANEGK